MIRIIAPCGVKYDKTLNHIVVAMLNRILSYLPSKTAKILALQSYEQYS